MENEQQLIRVLIADGSEETRASLSKLLSLEDDIQVVGEAQTGRQAIARAKELQPDIVLMDVHMPGIDGIAATETLQAEAPAVQVIMMSVVSTGETLRAAMLAGAREFLVKPCTAEDLSASVRRAYELRPTAVAAVAPSDAASVGGATAAPGTVIAVFGPKGGVGRTTVACNLAVTLAEDCRKRVALVDGRLRFGDVGVALGLRSERSIADLAATHPDDIDAEMVRSALLEHSSGVHALLAPPHPERGELISQQAMRTIIHHLRSAYEYVVVDLPPAMDEVDLAVVDVADQVVVLFTLDMAAIKDVKLFLDLAKALGYPSGKFALVANRVDAVGGVRLPEVEETLQWKTTLCLPEDVKLAAYAINKGVPFVTTHRGSLLAKAIADLGRILQSQADDEVEPTTKRGRPAKKAGGFSLFGRRRDNAA